MDNKLYIASAVLDFGTLLVLAGIMALVSPEPDEAVPSIMLGWLAGQQIHNNAIRRSEA